MGYYIEVPQNHGKTQQLVTLYGAELLAGAPESFAAIPDGKALVVVVQNGLFDAAGYAYDEREFAVFTNPRDGRPRSYLLMDKAKVRELAGTTR